MIIGGDKYSDGLNHYLAEGTQELRDYIKVNIYNGRTTEVDRITRYYLYWKFYRGEHFRDYNESMIAFNYVRAFIDKVNNFLVGEESLSFTVKRYDGEIVEPDESLNIEKLILKNWKRNKIDLLIHEILQMGSITGDCWVGVVWNAADKYCRIMCFDSRYCVPIFSTTEPGNALEAFTVRQPIEKDAGGYTTLVTEYTKERIRQYKRKTAADVRYNASDLETLTISDVENALNFIPIIHIKNKPCSEGYYGTSDAKDILKLNKVYNEIAQEMKIIVDYYTTPITIVTGATIKNMKRQVGNVWSGLPPEANVFNLSNEADLGGITDYMELLKKGMHEISDIPEAVLGKVQAISGTSAAALKLTYQPLVQQASLKALTYGEGIVEINELILRHYEVYNKKDKYFKNIEDDILEYRIEPVFSYGFPHDKMIQLQEFQMEKQLGLNSRRNMINALGYDNVDEIIKETDEDQIHTAMVQASAAKYFDGSQNAAQK